MECVPLRPHLGHEEDEILYRPGQNSVDHQPENPRGGNRTAPRSDGRREQLCWWDEIHPVAHPYSRHDALLVQLNNLPSRQRT